MATATLSEAQATQVAALTLAAKRRENREAARIAALIALYYQQRVDVEDPQAIERWLDLMIPRLINFSDSGARREATIYQAIRNIEVVSDGFVAQPSLNVINEGVRKSLLTVGPYDYMNKAVEIRHLDVSPQQEKALLAQAKQVTTEKIAAAVVRHAQAGGRQTVYENSQRDPVALGWIRVTKDDPCFFCAMLASRGVSYRPFKEGSFEVSNANFTGDGDAKVHDNCGCSLKPVYSKSDPMADRVKPFADMWSMWGAGGGDAALRFRRGYEHFRKTGEYWTWDQAESA